MSEKWFTTYLENAVIPLIMLYDELGIALEAHQQNSLLDLSSGYPAHYYYRDNQGYYLAKSYRRKLMEREPDLRHAEGLFYDDALIEDRFTYYLLLNQIFAVIHRFGVDQLLDESRLLTLLHDRLTTCAQACMGVGKSFIHSVLTKEHLAFKANLLTRFHDVDELAEALEQAVYVTIPNPFLNGLQKEVYHAIPSQLPSKNEQRIIRQLVESILFERLLPYQESDLQEGWKLFSISGAKRTYQCLGKRAAFDRVRLQGIPLISRSDGFQAIPTVAEIVEDAPLSKENQLALLHELEQTAQFSDWNDAHICKLPSRRDLSYDQLESALSEGHPYHPCFKARTGFTTADHRAYGNEADEGFKLTWIGIKKEAVAIYFPEEEHSFWQRELGYGQWSTIVKALCQEGGQLTEYRLFPVHPWQWDWLQKKGIKRSACE